MPGRAAVVRSMAKFSVAAAVISAVMAGWLMPLANQSHREWMHRTFSGGTGLASLPKDLNEMSLSELKETADDARVPEGVRIGARSALHQRFANPAACLVFGFLTVALSWQLYRRRRPFFFPPVLFAAALVAYIALWREGYLLAAGHSVPVWVGVWAPNIAFAVMGLLAAWWGIIRLPQPEAARE